MPGPDKKNLNKEIIREFDGKYAEGGTAFFLNQVVYDAGDIINIFHPMVEGVNNRDQMVMMPFSEKLGGLSAGIVASGVPQDRPKNGDVYDTKLSKLQTKTSGSPEIMNEGWELLQDAKKLTDMALAPDAKQLVNHLAGFNRKEKGLEENYRKPNTDLNRNINIDAEESIDHEPGINDIDFDPDINGGGRRIKDPDSIKIPCF